EMGKENNDDSALDKCATEESNDQCTGDSSNQSNGCASAMRVHKEQCRHARRLCKHYQRVLLSRGTTGEMTDPTHMLQTTLLSQSLTDSMALFRAAIACH